MPSVCLALALGQAGSASAAAAGHASTPAAPATSPPPVEARLLFLGDIMLGRYVGAAMAAHGPDAPFALARTWLSAADVTIANLEGPLVPPGAFAIPPPSPGLLNLTGSTASAAALARAGFDVLSVANNHSLDAREAGLAATVRVLGRVGIAPIGRRDGAPGGQTAAVREVRGIRVAFLAYTLVLNRSATMPEDRAAAVVAYVRPGVDADVAGVAREVAAARRGADAVAVVVHWGTEYARRPDPTQRRFAQVLAVAGADVIVGAHPHVVQGVEAIQPGVDPSASPRTGPSPSGAERRTAIVAYSLGNALFDQGGDAATREGAALAVDIGRNGVTGARLIPLAIAAGPTGFTMRRVVRADDVPPARR
ncbi:MAG: CapA family protein [Ardenticatenales bacterium]|nr:CapA family protein [Ardenticatenales bacterium]